EHDLALGDLRGLPPSSLAALALREPFSLMAMAAPIGAAIGWLAVKAVASVVLLPGTPVPFDSLAVVAALAGLVAGLAASVAGSARLLRRSEGAAAITRPRRRSGRTAAVLDAFAIAFAIAAIAELDASGIAGGTRSSPLATLAPGLIALGLGVIAARIAPLVCHLAARLTKDTPKVATHLSLQRVARRSVVVRQAIVMAIAVSLGCFSAGAFVVARHNRVLESQFQVGAGEVLTVTTPQGANLVGLVRRADPSGHVAMAAAELQASSGSLLAVDATRFSRVAAWPGSFGGLDASGVARYLRPNTAPPVVLSGKRIRVRADLLGPRVLHTLPESGSGSGSGSAAGSGAKGASGRATRPNPTFLSLEVLDTYYYALFPLSLGPLRPGSHTYSASLAGICEHRCRLVSIGASAHVADTSSGFATLVNVPLVLQSIAAGSPGSWHEVLGAFSSTARWRVPDTGSGAVSARILGSYATGLSVDFLVSPGSPPETIEPADTPRRLPAVVTNTVVAANAGSGPTGSTSFPAENLDGATITVNGQVQVPALPRIGNDGALVDLSLAERLMTQPGIYAADEVWLAPDASPAAIARVTARLEADGVGILATDSAARLERQFNRAGPTLAFVLFLLVAGAGALLAAGSLLFAIASSARRRSVELVALGAAGVPARKLVGALLGELSIVTLSGLVAGTLAGVLGLSLALRSVPEFSGLAPGPSLAYDVSVPVIVASVVALAVLFCIAMVIGVTAVRLKATNALLRFSER
ncbi:MAG: FtsX-like permease family protein, partial [Acidimicrobiales bacterium]